MKHGQKRRPKPNSIPYYIEEKKGVTYMKDQKLTEQQKKDIDLLSKLPKETQENLISYAAGMIAAQQILSRPQTA